MVSSPPKVDRIWGIWGSYFNVPKAIVYLLEGDYQASRGAGLKVWEWGVRIWVGI